MRIVSHPEADLELEAAALWYEERQPGLGDDFLDEFITTLRRIVADPERWRVVRGENRKSTSSISLMPPSTACALTRYSSKP